MMTRIMLAWFVLTFAGCKHLHFGGMSISNIGKTGEVQKITATKSLIFGFGYNQGLVFEAKEKLRQKCKKGYTGVSAVSEIRAVFVPFLAEQSVTMQAYCL